MTVSDHKQRAITLLKAGVVGWHVGALTVIGLGLALGGGAGAISALLGAGLVLAFSGVGMGVQVFIADKHPKQVFVASLASYALRAALLALALAAYASNIDRLQAIEPRWLAAGIIVTVVAWLGAELLAFRKLRIPVFDHDYQPPTT